MVDLDWKAKMITPETKSPKLSNRLTPSPRPADFIPPPPSAASAAYDKYLRLPELRRLWSSKNFPDWKSETIIKPSLQALEITFRLVSISLSDPRPHANRIEWEHRLGSLADRQIDLISVLLNDTDGAPITDLSNPTGILSRHRSSSEVWTSPGEPSASVLRRSSESSLLPRLATWRRSQHIAGRIAFSIESHFQESPVTLGIGEPNLGGKPNLDYDLICQPSQLHLLKKPLKDVKNYENNLLYTAHQILESWIFSAQQLLARIGTLIEARELDRASSDCWTLERIWRLLSEIMDLHLLMDPDDFLHLKSQLCLKSTVGSEGLFFRSTALVDLVTSSRDLRRRVPEVLGVEVDPNGGPRVQEAAMRVFHRKREVDKIHLLQSFQAIEGAMKRFFYGYWQLIVLAMGSVEAKGNRGGFLLTDSDSDPLAQLFMDPPYYPSLDAAKTFLGEFWAHECGPGSGFTRNGSEHKVK